MAAEAQLSQAVQALGARTPVGKCGPLTTVRRLGATMEGDELRVWQMVARCGALLGSCPGSIPSVSSGIRCWVAFATLVLRKGDEVYPPTLDGLLQYSAAFRCAHASASHRAHS